MEKREESLHEMMQELGERIEKAPAEKKAEIRSFIGGYLAALRQMQREKTA